MAQRYASLGDDEENDLAGAAVVDATVSLDELVHASLRTVAATDAERLPNGDVDADAAAEAATLSTTGSPATAGARKDNDEEEEADDGRHRRGGWRKRCCRGPRARQTWAWTKRHGILIGTVVGALLGLLIGALVGQAHPSPTAIVLIKLPGAVFMRMLKVLVVPLLLSSVITGVTTLRTAGGNRVAGWIFGLYLLTTAVAAVVGVVLVSLIKPGVGLEDLAPESGGATFRNTTTTEAMVALVYALVPDNIVASAASTDMLGIISFAIAFGAGALASGEAGERMIAWVADLNAIVMRLIMWVVYLTPIGVCSLLAGRLAEAPNFWGLLAALGVYLATVTTGLAIHALVLLPLLYWTLARKNPYRYMMRVAQPLLTAFATASSAATLPITIREAVKAGVPEPLAKFGLSVGCTINMNGTALYEAVAALFVANVYGIQLDASQTAIVVITAILAAVGASATPEAGVVFLASILIATGLPVEGVALILPVDWFCDRERTAVNVLGDLMVVGAVHGHQQRQAARAAAAAAAAEARALDMQADESASGGATEVLSMEAF